MQEIELKYKVRCSPHWLDVKSFSGYVSCALAMNCCRTIRMICCWSTLWCCTAEGHNPGSLEKRPLRCATPKLVVLPQREPY